MELSEVKFNLGKHVRLKLARHYIDKEYILTGCILRKKSDGSFFYQAELADLETGSLIIAGLENIFKLSSPTVGGRRS